jgi:hypothetical protein
MMAKQFVAFSIRRSLGGCACLAILGGLTIGVGAATADDDDIVNAGGFELPFTTLFGGGTGRLEGQINPAGEGQVIPPGQWLRSPAAGASTAVVQSFVFAPGGGIQAVRVDRAANNDARWAVPVDHLGYPDYPNPFPPEPAQPCICLTWDMRVQQTQGPPDTFGPFFGVEAYGDPGIGTGVDDGRALGGVRPPFGSTRPGLLGSLGVDATTGDVLYQATGTGFFTETGSVVNFNGWNHFQIKLDYSTDQYTIFRNFANLGTFGFVDRGLDQFSDGDISALAAAGDAGSQALPGIAYFDNFLIREGACPIPEPSTWILTLLGLLAMPYVARRRRHGPVRSAR